MTTTYYIPPEHISGHKAVLPAEEARHAVHVLRHQAGDEIIGVDGCGGWYRIVLSEVSKKQVVGDVIETRQGIGEGETNVTIALGLLKNQKRFEIFVEKACELGVSRIIPLQTRRTEKPSIRKDRLQKILIAAMKQSGRSQLVEMANVTTFHDLINRTEAQARLICHEKAEVEQDLLRALRPASTSGLNEILVAVGPEGGFSDDEVKEAVDAGFGVVSLGTRRLRAETAAITACAGIMLAFESQKLKVKS